MKFPSYFLSTRQRPDRKSIQLEWIEQAMYNPICERIQEDGRIRRWPCIEAAGGRHLRVVLLADGETVHNAFFDRTFER
jgi:hypothetical protein